MAKIMAYDDEARQKLASGVTKLARAVRCTLGPRGRNAVIDKGWGSPTVTKDGVTVAEEIELDRSLREHGRSACEGSGVQNLRCGRRRHHHRHRAGRGHLSRKGSRRLPPAPTRWRSSAGIDAAVVALVEDDQEAVQEGLGQERDHRGRLDRRPTTTARSARSWPTRLRRSAPTA